MNMLKTNKKGFTLVEIMIVVAIIALLAAIAIPGLLRARVNANDSLARSTVRAISTAAESFAAATGAYPTDVSDLTGATPAYMTTDSCADENAPAGYDIDCDFADDTSYTITATPTTIGTSGTRDLTVTTGGVLTDEEAAAE